MDTKHAQRILSDRVFFCRLPDWCLILLYKIEGPLSFSLFTSETRSHVSPSGDGRRFWKLVLRGSLPLHKPTTYRSCLFTRCLVMGISGRDKTSFYPLHSLNSYSFSHIHLVPELTGTRDISSCPVNCYSINCSLLIVTRQLPYLENGDMAIKHRN